MDTKQSSKPRSYTSKLRVKTKLKVGALPLAPPRSRNHGVRVVSKIEGARTEHREALD